MVTAKPRLAVLGFSDDVQVRLAVADMRTETSLPQVSIRGLTNDEAVFDDLLDRIPSDVQWLRGEGYKVHRPVVFFLSDGQPTDRRAWRQPHARLTDRATMPTVDSMFADAKDERLSIYTNDVTPCDAGIPANRQYTVRLTNVYPDSAPDDACGNDRSWTFDSGTVLCGKSIWKRHGLPDM